MRAVANSAPPPISAVISNTTPKAALSWAPIDKRFNAACALCRTVFMAGLRFAA